MNRAQRAQSRRLSPGCMPSHVRLWAPPSVQASRQVRTERRTREAEASSGPGDYTLQAPNPEATGVTICHLWWKQTHG